MSETAFRRSFREYTGLSPVEYRNKLRMEEADRLIRSGEYSVREAAEAVGCFNGSFFAKTYKSYFGHTPREHD
jgi:transcriptional regulator GlxA family with amidase domain